MSMFTSARNGLLGSMREHDCSLHDYNDDGGT